eukprot:COSAG01_NODE_6731_length_3524_cov_10.057963_5_plen_143_part_01
MPSSALATAPLSPCIYHDRNRRGREQSCRGISVTASVLITKCPASSPLRRYADGRGAAAAPKPTTPAAGQRRQRQPFRPGGTPTPATQVRQNGWLLSRRGRGLPAMAGGLKPTATRLTSRFDPQPFRPGGTPTPATPSLKLKQ